MILTDFHKELLTEFLRFQVDFVLIGGHAAILYGSERTTSDMDILVRPTEENGGKIINAFLKLKLEPGDLIASDFVKPLVLTFGFEPDGVDLINYLKDFEVETAIQNSKIFEFVKGLRIPVIDARDLLQVKQSLLREGRKGLSDQIDILSLKQYLDKS